MSIFNQRFRFAFVFEDLNKNYRIQYRLVWNVIYDNSRDRLGLGVL